MFPAHKITAEAADVNMDVRRTASNVRLLERVLQRRPGITLLVANTGEARLAIAHARRPALIFLDLHLSDMHGEALLRGLLENVDTQKIPVAVLSADAMPGQQRYLMAAGATAYLTKPLELDKLMPLVDETLSSKLIVMTAGDSASKVAT